MEKRKGNAKKTYKRAKQKLSYSHFCFFCFPALFTMESKKFILSDLCNVTVVNNTLSIGFGVTFLKKSLSNFQRLRLNLREWKTYASLLPQMVDTTFTMRAEVASKRGVPALREMHYILSSTKVALLSLCKSAAQGYFIAAGVAPYTLLEGSKDISIRRNEGLSLTMEEFLCLSEKLPFIEKYLSQQLSASKVIVLRDAGDVLNAQMFVEEFYESDSSKVRIMLEKPPQRSRVDAPGKVLEKKEGEEKKEDRNVLLECAKSEVRHNSTSSSSEEEGEKEERERSGTPHPESERNGLSRNGTERYGKIKNGKEANSVNDVDLMRDIRSAMTDIAEMNLIHLDKT